MPFCCTERVKLKKHTCLTFVSAIISVRKCGTLQHCVMTDAGSLPCKKIIHINALKEDWDDILIRAFQLVDQSGMRSLAIPALGTGILHTLQ